MEVKQKLAAEPAIEGIPNRSRIAPFNNRAGDGDEDVGVDPDMERKDTMRLGLPLSLRKKKMQRATKSVKIALATKMMATMTMHTKRTPTLL